MAFRVNVYTVVKRLKGEELLIKYFPNIFFLVIYWHLNKQCNCECALECVVLALSARAQLLRSSTRRIYLHNFGPSKAKGLHIFVNLFLYVVLTFVAT